MTSNHLHTKCLAIVLASLASTGLHAQVYKCQSGGNIVYQATPCPNAGTDKPAKVLVQTQTFPWSDLRVGMPRKAVEKVLPTYRFRKYDREGILWFDELQIAGLTYEGGYQFENERIELFYAKSTIYGSPYKAMGAFDDASSQFRIQYGPGNIPAHMMGVKGFTGQGEWRAPNGKLELQCEPLSSTSHKITIRFTPQSDEGTTEYGKGTR